jgi:hypothetical protein
MNDHLRYLFILSSRLLRIVGVAFALAPSTANAWTSASVAEVDVTVEVAADESSRVTTRARFDVAGGRFHGFDLADLEGATLVEEECRAVLDDGRVYPLSFRRVRGTRTRVTLAGGAEVRHGGVTFEFVHLTDLVRHGALRRYEGRARLDWTPLTWDEGLGVMRVHVVLPGPSGDAPIIVDRAVTQDYEVALADDRAHLTKFRPVRWYPMQVVLSFDPSLVPSLAPEAREEHHPPREAHAAAISGNGKRPVPPHVKALPAAVVLFGLIALFFKAYRVRRACGQLGIAARFRLLGGTGISMRLVLTVAAAALGLAVQYQGSIAAGIPALVAAASLWITRRERSSLRIGPGGEWRRMSEEDVTGYRRLLKAYRRARRSLMDITTVGGVVSFAAVLSGLGYLVIFASAEWPRLGWIAVIDGLILAVPAWFSSVRAELPVDVTLEGFATLRRWRRSLTKLVGASSEGSEAEFWVREDGSRPIEVRLRVEPPPAGLNGIEIAGEVLKAGSLHRTRTAVVLRLEPGTEAARRLATCPHAVEHHLTPDLEEEVIVLRNRRGRTEGLGPLRAALALLPG